MCVNSNMAYVDSAKYIMYLASRKLILFLLMFYFRVLWVIMEIKEIWERKD